MSRRRDDTSPECRPALTSPTAGPGRPGHAVAVLATNMLDQFEHLGPVGEARIAPDPPTYVPLPRTPGAAAGPSNPRRPDGSLRDTIRQRHHPSETHPSETHPPETASARPPRGRRRPGGRGAARNALPPVARRQNGPSGPGGPRS
ncbi:hypothetical protein ACGF0J_24325 [Nonomuraea sp. NPDC047897]|uniref:hypothetical protein n=1 Tax=Nonomuraea sp. NPDC047897 TaxID=3364346 RepID=UPI00371AB9B0